MQSADIRPAKRLERTPRVFVTRHLMPSVEDRMRELFDTELNLTDEPMGHDALVDAVGRADVLVPTITDRDFTIVTLAAPTIQAVEEELEEGEEGEEGVEGVEGEEGAEETAEGGEEGGDAGDAAAGPVAEDDDAGPGGERGRAAVRRTAGPSRHT